VAEKKNVKSRLRQILTQANAKKRLAIIDMPEELETTPHWMLWLVALSLVGLIGSIIWQSLADNSSIQAYLPFLFS
jgi:hypothetical protein